MIAEQLEQLWINYDLSGVSILSEGKREEYEEGILSRVISTKFERNPIARKKCIEHFGYRCNICGFDFEKIYGPAGKEYIHVHHIKPLSTIREKYTVNPVKDLIPVCANCHAIIHKRKSCYTIDEMDKLIQESKFSLKLVRK